MRRAVVAVAVLSLTGCKWLPKHKSVQDAGVDAAVLVVDAGPTTQALDPKDLPLGSWESTSGAELALSILPGGLVRFATEVPSYRNPARVFGQVTNAIAGSAPNTFMVWVSVTKIYAKEIGPQHRRWVDFELFEAEILGQRVTSPNQDAQRIPQLGGKGSEAERGYQLTFAADRASVDVCTMATVPKCQTLAAKKSPSDISRVRTNGLCKVDDDCIVVTDGEQCDPCICPTKASLKTWPRPKPKPGEDREDLSWETSEEHLCGKEIERRDDCAVCPTLKAVCRNKACILKNGG